MKVKYPADPSPDNFYNQYYKDLNVGDFFLWKMASKKSLPCMKLSNSTALTRLDSNESSKVCDVLIDQDKVRKLNSEIKLSL